MKQPLPFLSLRKSRGGFTLLEIMMVVIIISLLLGTAIHKLGGSVNQAKLVRVRADIDSISTSLMTYEGLNGSLPTSSQGLMALVAQPSGDPAPKNWVQSMEKIPNDPWGHPYQYEAPGTHNSPKGYDLYSLGPPNGSQIGNWDDTN